MTVGASNLGFISCAICFFGILSLGSSYLQCYKCDKDATQTGDCTSNMCTGKCATITYSTSVEGGTVDTTELRMCVPNSFSNEDLCKSRKPVSISGTACKDVNEDCTCMVTRCSTDKCNGMFAQVYKTITKEPMAIFEEEDSDVQISRDTQTDNSASGSSVTHVSMVLLAITLILR